MIRLGAKLLMPALLIALAIPGGSAAGDRTGSQKRCFPATPECASQSYERKAAQAASRAADDRFNLDFPPNDWTVVCFAKAKRATKECSVHTRDDIPYTCVGGMTMKKRDGRWRAKDIELSCSR